MEEITTQDEKRVAIYHTDLVLNPNILSGIGTQVDEKNISALLSLSRTHYEADKSAEQIEATVRTRYANLKDEECFNEYEKSMAERLYTGELSAEQLHDAATKTGNTACILFIGRAMLQRQLLKNAKK